jgi:CRISPR-associated protein Cmr6
MPIYCPSDTQNLVKNRNNISNFALRYQRFLKNEEGSGGRVKFSIDVTDLGDSQGTILPLRDRQTNQLDCLAKNYHIFCGFYEVDWRMVIGLGGGHVQETNMTLDHIYGIPYLPGSTFKGVVRGWVIQEYFGNDEDLAMRDIKDDDSSDLQQKKKVFSAVFGNQKFAGKVQFLPAYPIGNVTLSLDIMNPHFPSYYTGVELPTDTQDPNPINFLTIRNTPFRFVILLNEQNLLKTVEDWTDKTLKNKGLGAKTASGYGYFRQQFNVQKSLRPNVNFQIPLRTRPTKPQQISLDEANDQFSDPNEPNPNPQLIEITPIKNCAAQLAQVATRDDLIELSQLAGIHATLIEQDEDYAMVSDFGKWIWENLKAELLSSRILELPRLIYSIAFRKTLKKLPLKELVGVQEELIAIYNQLEEGNGDLESVVVAEHFRYAPDTNEGTLTFWEYIN